MTYTKGTIKGDLLEYWYSLPNQTITGPKALDFYCRHPKFRGSRNHASLGVYRILARCGFPEGEKISSRTGRHVFQWHLYTTIIQKIEESNDSRISTTVKNPLLGQPGWLTSSRPSPNKRTITVEVPPSKPEEVSMNGQVITLAGRKYRLVEEK